MEIGLGRLFGSAYPNRFRGRLLIVISHWLLYNGVKVDYDAWAAGRSGMGKDEW